MYCNWYCEKYLRTPLLTYTFYFDLLETFDYLILSHFYNGRILISNNKGIMEKNETNRKCAHPDIFFSLND